jgi:hypothetical protein
MQIAAVIFSLLIFPGVASAQTSEIAPISVCMDAKKPSSCLTGENLIRTLYGKGLVRTSLGWKVRNDLFVNPVLGKQVQYGETSAALFVVEEVKPDPDNNRPEAHASTPNMAIALFNWVDGTWKLLSQAKGLKGVGGWGSLNVDHLIVHIAGHQQYFLEIPSGYTGQGITESFSVFYASFAPNGKPSAVLKELGGITTSSDGCASGFEGQVHEEGELIVFFKEQQYPDLILYKTQSSCQAAFFKKTLPPQFFIFDKKSESYRPKNQKN